MSLKSIFQEIEIIVIKVGGHFRYVPVSQNPPTGLPGTFSTVFHKPFATPVPSFASKLVISYPKW